MKPTGLKKTSTTFIEGRWPIKGPTPTVSEIVDLAEILIANDVDLAQPIHLEPAGINGAGKEDPACFRLAPYRVEEKN